MEREGDANPGGMRAVVGLEIDAVEKAISEYTGNGVVTAANHNTPQQIVISGDMEGLDAVTPVFEEAGAKVRDRVGGTLKFNAPGRKTAGVIAGPGKLTDAVLDALA